MTTPAHFTATNPNALAEQLVGARSRVASLANLLGLDELQVLEAVAHGLARGRAIYGELQVTTDARDFTSEGSEEIRDALVYLGAELIRLQRRTRLSSSRT